MKQTIKIDPVTRIEGHAKVILDMDSNGKLESARLIVNELRGFERILIGMEAESMPLITARICGVCPSAHHLAASKALDAAAGVRAPKAARLLRELLYMGHFIHSHTLSLFVLQGPDLVMGLDADPAVRNVVGVVKEVPETAKKALRLRSLGQKINEMIGGRGIHPVTSVAGGITFKLDQEKKKILECWINESIELVQELAETAKVLLLRMVDAHPALTESWKDETCYMATLSNGSLNFYDGLLRVINSYGEIIKEFEAKDYKKHLSESVLDWSYMKPVQLILEKDEKFLSYRVNTLGRINTTESITTPIADNELQSFKAIFGDPCHLTVMHIYARLIELIHACEKASILINNPAIFGETRREVKFTGSIGVGHVEAPRGSLFHEYEIDDDGVVRSANLIVATQQNYLAINESIRQAAESHVAGVENDKAVLNAVEFAIRCYDPCLSCATHAAGQMPLDLEIMGNGERLRSIKR